MEGYHLSATHFKTLHEMTPTALCKKVPGEAGFTAYRSYFPPHFPDRGPYHPDLTEDEKRNTILFCPYPSFVVALAPNFTFYLCLRPLGPDHVGVRWGVAGFRDDPDSAEVQAYVPTKFFDGSMLHWRAPSTAPAPIVSPVPEIQT